METTIDVLVFVGFAGATVAQQQAAAPVRMECRELSSGEALVANESLMNGLACHVVGAKQDVAAKSSASVAAQPPSHATAEPSQSQDFSVPAPVDTHIQAGATVFV